MKKIFYFDWKNTLILNEINFKNRSFKDNLKVILEQFYGKTCVAVSICVIEIIKKHFPNFYY